MNKFLSLSIVTVFASSFVFADQTITTDPVDVAVSQVASVYNLQHKLESSPKKPLFDSLRVLISEKDGSHTNSLGTAYLLIAGPEDGSTPGALHKFQLGMSSIKSVTNKWVNADNSSAGGYLFIKGVRIDPETSKARSYSVTVKYTDSTNVYLDELEIYASYSDKTN
ncbi:MAG: hypothetical protein KA116_04985 [Proteobacteria bacterium]|nr:hypothetical protein [Pseudomonadota bacterium]